MPVLRPIIYVRAGACRDFRAMIQHPDFVNSLFIFNDNEAQLLSKSCVSGGGNASIRPHQCLDRPRATGIPTGKVAPGCTSPSSSKGAVDQSSQRTCDLLKTCDCDCVFCSSTVDGRTVGASAFDPDWEVKDCIVRSLESHVVQFELLRCVLSVVLFCSWL